eukprot:TRINITY_DN1990_c0_g1_i2.p1 TRINITY_DN1990_c0_g1~~TRINITY_DN1990_c0_g1_i2.p1  ORF type:complete len:275 (-),score=37.20 TRINITY_DN1990_c0_g1_i2:152-943(-)
MNLLSLPKFGLKLGNYARSKSVLCYNVHRRQMAVLSWNVAYGIGALATVAAGVGVARAAGLFGDNSQQLIKNGMNYFKQNEIEKALDIFDLVLEKNPELAPRLWQRGIALYYLNEFEEGAAQFRKDVEINPNDTEEAIWAFLCESQFMGVEKARQNFMVVKQDPRPVLRKAYEVFKEGSDPNLILQEIRDKSGVKGDYFYANFYVGLYHESNENEAASKEAILNALKSTYAESFGDYMVQVAKIHCLQRGWDADYMAWRASKY